jgi:hypothetical protein
MYILYIVFFSVQQSNKPLPAVFRRVQIETDLSEFRGAARDLLIWVYNDRCSKTCVILCIAYVQLRRKHNGWPLWLMLYTYCIHYILYTLLYILYYYVCEPSKCLRWKLMGFWLRNAVHLPTFKLHIWTDTAATSHLK